MLKSARIWFSKDDTAKYISHLDLNRCILRAIHHSKLPVWYTEGFNPHPFVTFALPLSLGFRGLKESMDVKLEKEIDNEEFIKRLNSHLPQGIRILAITEPLQKPKCICYADYSVKLTSDILTLEEVFNMVNALFDMDEIMVQKKSKAGIKEVDLKENLCRYTIKQNSNNIEFTATLPAGNTTNVNPMLFVTALENLNNTELYADITRLEVYNEEVEPFE